MTEPLEARLRRLEQERDEADRRYNEALTALDGAVPGTPAPPDPVVPLDEHQLPTLNQAWNILPAPPSAGGLRQKLAGFVWRTVAPYLERQLTFNSVLVDHINRNVEALRLAHRRDTENAAALRAQAEALTAFHARLMVYLQQITAYVDTKDRDSAGGALVLNTAISELAEAQGKYRESLAAREHRYVARTTALSAAHEELRGMIGVAQQAIAMLKRTVAAGGPAPTLPDSSSPAGPAGMPPPRTAGADAFAPALDAYKYVGFEDRFRGPEEVIRARQESYLPFFAHLLDPGTTSPRGVVLDVGCGRGEFIDLLTAYGIPARGIDLNHEMAELCRSRGLDVIEADVVGHLSSLPDGSLGGLFAAQVVEHLEPGYLLRFLDLAFDKLQPGGILVLETLNPACWTAFFESYIRDVTHRWPLHPETLQYLVTASGFTRAAIEFRSPVPPQDRLQPIPVAGVRRRGPPRDDRDLQRQRRKAQRADVHVHGLRDRCRQRGAANRSLSAGAALRQRLEYGHEFGVLLLGRKRRRQATGVVGHSAAKRRIAHQPLDCCRQRRRHGGVVVEADLVLQHEGPEIPSERVDNRQPMTQVVERLDRHRDRGLATIRRQGDIRISRQQSQVGGSESSDKYQVRTDALPAPRGERTIAGHDNRQFELVAKRVGQPS